MPLEKKTGLGTQAFYGPRGRCEGQIGQLNVDGAVKQLVIEVTGKNINDDILGAVNASFSLPKGALPLRAIFAVEEAFVLTGTLPTIAIGTDGSEETNGVELAEADAEAVGTYVVTSFAGTFAAELAAATVMSVALGGTASPTVTSAGKLRMILEYVLIKA